MDVCRAIIELTRRLQAACEQQAWIQVRQLDGKVAELLTQLSGRTLSTEVQAALKQLQACHKRVYEECSQQSKEVEQKMAEHRQMRDALQAYAIFSADDEGQL